MSASVQSVIAALERIAPPQLAGTWDNVGLLIEPVDAAEQVTHGLLTIDLTAAVLDEAVALDAQFIVSYHPLMFGGVKALVRADPHTRVILDTVRHGITVYSPHTALDAVVGGMNDWLLTSVGAHHSVEAIEPALDFQPPAGAGRRAHLSEPVTLDICVERLKGHLGLSFVRVAAAASHARGEDVSTVAVCPGAGGALLSPLSAVDLVVTGELGHHSVLALNAAGTSVILTDHTNCERGYLPTLIERLKTELGEVVTWAVSAVDRDPLQVV